jgi:HlyD family secretion protein
VAAAALAAVVVGVLAAGRLGVPEVEVVPVARQTVIAYVEEDGKTRLPSRYTIDMPVTGTLERIALEVGDAVEKGQVVARIDPFEIQQEIERVRAEIAASRAQIAGVDVNKPKPQDIEASRARAHELEQMAAATQKQLEVARVNAENARREYERLRRLHEENAVSQSQFEEAERAYEALRGEVERLELGVRGAEAARRAAELGLESLIESVDDNEYQRQVHRATIQGLEATLAELQDRLAKTEVRSPVSGVVVEKPIESERVLAAGTPLLELGNLSEVEIESDILSEEVSRVQVGMPVEISGEALGERTVSGKVTRIYPAGFEKISALGIEQQRVKVIVGFDNTELRLRPGVSVDVRIVTAVRENVPAVPDRAVFRDREQWYAFAVRDGRAVRTPVTLGLRNDRWAEVVEGLGVGEAVVAEPTSDVDDGMRVRPVPAP